MMTVHFCGGPIACPADAARANPLARKLFHLEMIARGQYMVQRGMINQSLPMTDQDRDGLVEAVDGFLDEYGGLLADG
jgi:glutamate-1-semialdehyde aminotransferase